MSIDNAHPWDVLFTISGTDYGFMLESPEGKSKQIAIQEAGPPDVNRISTAQQQTTSLYNPRIDTPFSMSTWVGGLGQLKYDLNDSTKYWWGSGVVTHVDGKVYLAPPDGSLTVAGMSELTGSATWIDNTAGTRYDFIWEGTKLWRRDASNSSNVWVNVYTAGQNITSFAVMDDIGLIASPGDVADYVYQTDLTAAATWTPTTAAHSTLPDEPKFFHVVRDTVYAAYDNNFVFYSTDPTVDSWIGPINTSLEGNIGGAPGDNSYPIVGMASVGDYLFVLKQDAIYSIDASQDVIESVWQWKDKPSVNNFTYFDTGVYFLSYSVGNEVYIYNPINGANNKVGLSMQSGFSTKKVLGIAQDNRYLYVLAEVNVPNINTGDDSVALFRCFLNRTEWIIECLWEHVSPEDNYKYLTIFPSGDDWRLYWGTVGKTNIMDIPSEWDESSSGSHRTAGKLYTSITESNFVDLVKRHMFLDTDGIFSASLDVDISYSIDGGSTFSSLGNVNSNNATSSYSSVESRDICLLFDFDGTGTDTPILNRFVHHARPRFRYLEFITLALRVSDWVELRNLAQDDRTADSVYNDLKTIRSSDETIGYKDFLGSNFNVSIDAFTIRPTRHEGPGEHEFTVELAITRADAGT